MRKALLISLAVATFSCAPRPVIDSFTVDEPNPDSRAPVQFSYSVRGATGSVRIDPIPGIVHESPVTVFPIDSGTFTLRAFNSDGVEASRHLSVTVRAPFLIQSADASPGQVAPGAAVTLSWLTSSAERATLTDGATGEVSEVEPNGFVVVRPLTRTVYTLTAYNKPGRMPESRTAKITARVTVPPTVSDFMATPSSIMQGDAAMLSWSGNAVSYSVTDGTSTFSMGARRSLVVRPTATTTYALHAAGPGGILPNPPTVRVTVSPYLATGLVYSAPPGAALQLVADDCSGSCAAVTLRIKATASVQLRGAALDLPLDATKVSFVSASFAAGLPGAVAQATMGSGLLQDVLVVGIALKGSGTAPAPDLTLNPGAELASFRLALLPAGGRGTVFDGAAPSPAYKASIQTASGRAANAIAVGKLEAQ